MASYYRRFIPHFVKIAGPRHQLTGKEGPFQWTLAHQEAFEALKTRLTEAPVLAYPAFDQNFVLETDASGHGLGAVLSQCCNGKSHPVAYASRALSSPKENYLITELETLAVVWAINHFRCCVYGRAVTVYIDHSAVKAVLETPNPTGKHAWWWKKLFGSGIAKIQIVYHSRKENTFADALFRNRVGPTPPDAEVPIDVLAVWAEDISTLLGKDPNPSSLEHESFQDSQKHDPWFCHLTQYLTETKLPDDESVACRIVLQAPSLDLQDGILYLIDSNTTIADGTLFSTNCSNSYLSRLTVDPLVSIFRVRELLPNLLCTGGGAICTQIPLSSVELRTVRHSERFWPASQASTAPHSSKSTFQTFGVDIMKLPKTSRGNSYVVVFQDLFTKSLFMLLNVHESTSPIVTKICFRRFGLLRKPSSVN